MPEWHLHEDVRITSRGTLTVDCRVVGGERVVGQQVLTGIEVTLEDVDPAGEGEEQRPQPQNRVS